MASGFQTYAMSEGITEDERKEIEAQCSYVAPTYLPTQPKNIEIIEDFPVSFSYFKLASGRSCICQTKYSGKDYSGRYGNYFSHVLLLESGSWQYYPIMYYGSITFKEKLTEEEEAREEIAALPALNSVEIGRIINYQSVSDFVKGNSINGDKRRKYYKPLMDALFSNSASGRKLIIADRMDNIAKWIAAATIVLPRKLSDLVTFNTYSFNPEYTGTIITGTFREGCHFEFSETQKEIQYYVLDCIKDEGSSTVEHEVRFSKLAQVGLMLSRESIQSFIEFLQEFHYNKLDGEIDDALNLFSMTKTGLEGIKQEGIINAINFYKKYVDKAFSESLFNAFKAILPKISSEIKLHCAKELNLFFLDLVKATTNEKNLKTFYQFFFESLDQIISKAEENETEAIFKFYNCIRELNAENKEQFVLDFFSMEKVNKIKTNCVFWNPWQCKLYMIIILHTIDSFKMKYEVVYKLGLEDLFEKLEYKILQSTEELQQVFTIAKKNTLIFANIASDFYKKAANKNIEFEDKVVRLFTSLMDEYSLEDKIILWVNIYHAGGSTLLFKEYKYRLNNSESKTTYFWSYCSDIFDKIPSYKNSYFSKAVLSLLQSVDTALPIEEYMKILRYIMDKNIEVAPELLLHLVEQFEKLIKIGKLQKETEIFVLQLKEFKTSYKIVSKPDVCDILCFGKELMACKHDSDLLNKIGQKNLLLSKITLSVYEALMDWYLPMVVKSMREVNDYAFIKKLLYVEEHEKAYYDKLLNFMNEMMEEDRNNENKDEINSEVPKLLSRFIVFIIKNKENFNGDTYDYIFDNIVELLMMASKAQKSNMDKEIKSIDIAKKDIVKKEWKSMCQQAQNSSGKPWIFRIFKEH